MSNLQEYKNTYKEDPWVTLDIKLSSSEEDAVEGMNSKVYYIPHFLGIKKVNIDEEDKYRAAYSAFLIHSKNMKETSDKIKKGIALSLFFGGIKLYNMQKDLPKKIVGKITEQLLTTLPKKILNKGAETILDKGTKKIINDVVKKLLNNS